MNRNSRKLTLALALLTTVFVLTSIMAPVQAQPPYQLQIAPNRVQEGFNGGGQNVIFTLTNLGPPPQGPGWYRFDFIVTDPSGGPASTCIWMIPWMGGPLSLSAGYPTPIFDPFYGPQPPWNGPLVNNLVGTYYVKVDAVPPFAPPIPGIALGSFDVKLTDKDLYQRTETVGIQGKYAPNEWVWVNVTYAGTPVGAYPKQVQASVAGIVTDSWIIPKDAGLGTYTVDLHGTTSPPKPVADTQTFTVNKADLAVTWSFASGQSRQRTLSIGGKVKITYPGTQVMTDTDLGANTFDIKLYKAGSPTAHSVTVSAADWDGTDSFDFSWTIPKDAALGADYTFAIETDAISDSYSPPNTGPTGLTQSNSFTVVKADLTIDIVTDAQLSTADPNDGDGDIERTETVIFEFRVKYPDLTNFISSDFGSITATLYYGAGSKCSVTATSADTLYQDTTYGDLTIYFDSASDVFTVKWKIPIDADLTTLADKYDFTITGYDAVLPTPNSLVAGQDSSAFDVVKADLAVSNVAITETSVERTEDITVAFHVEYPDGTYPVQLTAGTIQLEDGTVIVFPGSFPITGTSGDFTVVIDTAPDTPTGDYWAVVKSETLDDGNGNTGPASDVDSLPDVVTVYPATLSVDVTSTESDYSTPDDEYGGLETLYFTAEINYPDGTNFTTAYGGAANADIWVDTNSNGLLDPGEFYIVEDLSLVWSSGNVWHGTYDLYPPGAIYGTYTINVTASDTPDNSGTGTDTFDVVPETLKDPTEGPVGTEVHIWGSGFAPNTDVYILWDMFIEGDFVGMGDGETVDFNLVLPGMAYVSFADIYLNDVPTTDYELDPSTGVVTFFTPPAYGVVITADYELIIPLTTTTTDEYGSFDTTFVVPESYVCEHWVIAVQMTEPELGAFDLFCVEPQIVLSSTKGPPEAWITVTGTGFAPNTEVDVWVEYWYEGMWHFVEEWSWGIAVTDAYGTFSQAILLPTLSLQAMYHESGIAYGVYMICAMDYSFDENYAEDDYLAVLFCEPSVIDVEVKTGALYFSGEIVTVYALTSVDGVPMDVHNITFLLYHETLGPMPLSQFLPAVHVDTGLYAVTSTISPDTQPGNYLIVVTATKSCWIGFEVYFDGYEDYLEWEVTINGVGMDGFIISPTLMDMNAMLIGIEGDIATINTNIGLIQLDLTAINAKLTSIQGSIATIETNIGTIQTDISTINGAISSIQGNIVTITSDLGTITADIADINGHLASIDGSIITIQTDIATIKTDISSINGHIATIEGDIVTIETDIGTIKTDISAIDGRLTSIEGGVAIIQTAIGDIEVKLDETVIPFLEAIEAKLDVMGSDVIVIKTAIGDVETKLDDTVIPLLQAVNATIVSFEEKVDGYYLALNTTIGEIVLKVDPGVFVYLEAIEAKLDAIGPGVVRIESAIGDVEVKLDDISDFLVDIKAEIVALKGDVATLNTTLGIIQTDISNINLRVTSIEGDIATISTTLGTIEGRLTTIEGDIATIKTDIGEIQVDLPPLKETSSAIQSTTTLGMSIGSVLSAIAAIAAVAACILIFRRLRVAS